MKNMDKSVKILIILLGVALILFVTNLVIDNNTSKDYSNAKYIEIKGEKIDSIYNVIGSKKITKVNEGIDSTGNYIEITYSDLKISEITDYMAKFKAKNYALISSDAEKVVIANESKETGKIITITIKLLDDETVIKYSKGNGTLERK